ncbi:MAG: DUF2336 domain-containing protein [Alphaproteobacteria bacterium]|nr:DUF2336 domain-containing protein [Alphaproteobacteria bacterium]
MTQEAGNQRGSLPGVDYLLEMARDRSEAGRALLVNTVCDLFVDRDYNFSGRESALMTDILRRLIGEVEAEVRKNLAERLCKLKTVPRELIVELANDNISIAQSILRNSPVLRDPDLIEIIRHRAREHHLAIAVRLKIGASVSDALVGTDDVGVITTLLENRSAVISVLTLEYLVEQSERIDAFHQPLLHREELSDELASKMYGWISAALREHITGRFDIPDAELDKAIDGSVSKAASETRKSRPGGKAGELADRLSRSDMLTPQGLIQVLREGEIPLFEAMFARFTGLELNQIKKVIYEAGGQSLAVACKASHVQKPDFASIFLLSRHARPGDKTVEPTELATSMEFFDRIDVAEAEKILKLWRRRPDHNKAILDLQTSRSD